MNSLLIAIVVAVVVSVALVAVSTILIAQKIRERKAARAERIRREKMHLLNEFEVDFGKKINIKGKDAFITEVTVNGHKYTSVREAILQEGVSKRRTKQMLELEAELEFMRNDFMPKVEEQVVEARIENEEKRVEKDEEKQYIPLQTDTEGIVYIYKTGKNIMISPFVAIDITEDANKTLHITRVRASKEGLSEGLSESRYVPFSKDESLQKKYLIFEANYANEASSIKVYQERMNKYNKLVQARRLLWDNELGKYVIEPEIVAEEKDPKQVVNEQFNKDENKNPEPSYTTMD